MVRGRRSGRTLPPGHAVARPAAGGGDARVARAHRRQPGACSAPSSTARHGHCWTGPWRRCATSTRSTPWSGCPSPSGSATRSGWPRRVERRLLAAWPRRAVAGAPVGRLPRSSRRWGAAVHRRTLRMPGFDRVPAAWRRPRTSSTTSRHHGRRCVVPGAASASQTWGWTIDEPIQGRGRLRLGDPQPGPAGAGPDRHASSTSWSNGSPQGRAATRSPTCWRAAVSATWCCGVTSIPATRRPRRPRAPTSLCCVARAGQGGVVRSQRSRRPGAHRRLPCAEAGVDGFGRRCLAGAGTERCSRGRAVRVGVRRPRAQHADGAHRRVRG